LQCVVVCCSVCSMLQCVAGALLPVSTSLLPTNRTKCPSHISSHVLQCVADCCAAVCCSVVQCVPVYRSLLRVCCYQSQHQYCQHFAQSAHRPLLHCVADRCAAVCCSVLQCVAVCCSVLQCVAVRCSVPVSTSLQPTSRTKCTSPISSHDQPPNTIAVESSNFATTAPCLGRGACVEFV